MNTTSLRILTGLIALFGFGAGSGYVVARRANPLPPAPHAQETIPAPGPLTNIPTRFFARWSEARITEYRGLLNLTPAQETAMRRHFATLDGEYDTLRAEVRGKLADAITRANRDITRDLTPEQRRRFLRHLGERARQARD